MELVGVTRADIMGRRVIPFDNCEMDIDFSHWGPGFDAFMVAEMMSGWS